MTTRPIVVVGAGLAGLAAALNLHRAGRDVVVLEANSRVGGRVYTLQGFNDGRVAEGGGEFINAEHLRIQALAREFALPLEIVPGMDQWFSWLVLDGKLGAADDDTVWGLSLEEEIHKIDRALAELGQRVDDPANPQNIAGAAELDQMPAAAWLESLDVHPLACKAFAARLRAEFLVEPEGHSTLDLARWGSLNEAEGVEGPTYHIIGGNGKLAQALAAELPDLRLRSRVTAVQRHQDSVSLSYEADGRSHTLTADQIILALPLEAVRTVQFDPPLSPAYQRALDDLRLGAVAKVILEYERPFWHEAGWNGLLLTDLPMNCVWLTAGGQIGEGGMLTVYTGGRPAAQYAAMPDEARIAAVLSQIESLFPGSSACLKSSRTIAWLNEPFVGGGYAFFPPGSVMAHWATLRQPQGRIHLAGEHTAVYQGYMEGAVESGQRAAAAILELSNPA
jgi:monoamine oxidase